MAIDILQEKIRKAKNPSMLELAPVLSDVPPHLLEGQSPAQACERYCRELLAHLRGFVPAVRVSHSAFSLLGGEGMAVLQTVLKTAGELGYYVLLDAPQILSPKAAVTAAETLLAEGSLYPCDGLLISGYLGSDVLKPFLPYCKKGNKDLFVVVRTANKSASELQDLLTGARLVHAAAADQVNRFGGDTTGKFGYSQVGILAAASFSESLRSLRTKYPRMFLVLDGYDYSGSNAKNCSYAFDKFGHGAVACGNAMATAWQGEGKDPSEYLAHAMAAAERMKKNLGRYVTVL